MYFTAYQPRPLTGEDSMAVVSVALRIAALGLALVAAWDAGRLRRARIAAAPSSRHLLRIVVDALAPTLALVIISWVASLLLVISYLGGPAPGLHDTVPVVRSLAIPFSAVAVGFLLGFSLPPVIARPLAVVITALWVFVAYTLGVPWLRAISGFDMTLPTYTDVVDRAYLMAPAILALGLLLGLVAFSLLSRPALRAAAVACCVLAGFAASYPLVSDAPRYADPTVPRTWATTCERTAPVICVPSEFADDIPELHSSAEHALPRLREVGFTPPRKLAFVSEDLPLPRGTWRTYLQKPVTEHRSRAIYVSALVPSGLHDCPDLPDDYVYPARGAAFAWVGLTVGMSEEEAARSYGPSGVYRARWVRSFPKAKQYTWYKQELRYLNSCDEQLHEKARAAAKAENERGRALGPRLEDPADMAPGANR
ncbi:hypothetical protein [Streptomyces sp. NPDC057689]|uniref:DUF7224 domain-containing protein n=1 Tax=Streptomyces sp. NPDC057689 TaxID=3346213 RepID=UPI003677A670